MKRPLISLLLSLVLLCALLPRTAAPARAEDEPVLSGVCGEDLSWSFDPDTGVLTLEGSGEGQFSPKQPCTREQIVTFL